MMHTRQQQEQESRQSPASCAARLVARGVSRRPLRALASTMATLALDSHHPIALEVASDGEHITFQVRASTPEAARHLTSQLQALYPQARMALLAPGEDPLRLERNEAVTVVELAVRGQPYLSLATPDAWAGQHSRSSQATVGDDPLLAVVGALRSVPEGMRAIAQLALVPAPAQWSRPYRRKAVEHPLEPERERARRQQRQDGGPSMGLLVALALLVVLALLWRRFGSSILPLLPQWLKQDGAQMMHGHLPVLSSFQIMQLAAVLGLLFFVVFLISRLWNRLQRHPALYDQRAVGEKTKQVAYRARLRLLVIGKVEPMPLWRGKKWAGHALRGSSRGAWIGQLWQWARTRWRQRRWRRQMAVHLAAAYRQYDHPAGNVLVPQVCHLRRAHVLARPRASGLRCARRFMHRLHQRALIASASPRRRMRFALRCLWRLCEQATESLLLGRPRWQRGVRASPLYLSVEEVAALWHLIPEQDAPEIAGLERGLARSRPLPPRLANASPTELLPYQLGTCTHAGRLWPVFAPVDLFHHNSLAVASTGKGKSTLFSHLALAHLAGNPQEGLFFLEPHGDTITALLGSMPASRQDDVTLIDLADEQVVVGLNPLDMTQGRGRDKTVDDLLAVFAAFWQKQRSWGPRTENILQFALLALAEANLRRLERDGEDMGADHQYTLLDVIPLLQKPSFRHLVLDEVRDRVVRDWFTHYYDLLRPSFRDEVISPVINKISKYAAAKVSRRLLGQSRATVRLADDIRAGRVLLINTASGIVGEEVSALVGATLVGLFQAALAEQVQRPPAQRRRFWVVIDEFQTYLGIDYNNMLAELRKYGGSFALATQSLSYLDELDRALKPTVLANSDHLFCFAMETADARQLSPYLDGLEASDLMNLDAYTCYARWTMQGSRLPAFSLQIAPPPAWDAQRASSIRQHANERHSRPAALVDEEVSPQPLQPLSVSDNALWPDDLELEHEESASGEAALTTGEKKEADHAVPTRKRGGRRGKGSTAQQRRTDDQPLAQPYVLAGNESGRLRPRSHVWQPEDCEDNESGEMRGA